MLILAIAPEGWVALAVVVVAAVAAQRRADREDTPAALPGRGRWLLELAALLLVPVGLLVVATLTDVAAAGERDTNTVLYAVLTLVVMELALGSWLIWRHRHRWLGTVVLAGGLCWWTLGVAFIADMALTDNWV